VIDDEVERLRLLLQNVHEVQEPSVFTRFVLWMKQGQTPPKVGVESPKQPRAEKDVA